MFINLQASFRLTARQFQFHTEINDVTSVYHLASAGSGFSFYRFCCSKKVPILHKRTFHLVPSLSICLKPPKFRAKKNNERDQHDILCIPK